MDSMRKKEWEKVTGTPYRKCKVLTTLGGVAPGNKDTQAHYPLHRYTIDKKGKGFMNKEYHALFAVAVGDIHGDAPETETVAEQVNEGEDAEQVYFRVKAKHDGPAWQAAVDGLYNKIRLATWLSEPAKQVLGRSLDDLVPFAVRRIVENLGHHAIGRGFERIVDENGKVKFTYDAEKDVGGVGEKEMRKQATDWLKSYVQQEYQVGIGKRRGRTGAQSLERGGSTGEGDEGAVDVSTEQGRQFTGIGQDSAGKYYATPRDEDKSHFVQHGYSDRDFIRRNSQKGSDLSGLKKKISNRMNAFMSRLAQDQANWLNNNPGKTEIPGKVMDLLIASMVNDKKFMADNDMGHLSSAEALKALDSKELKDKLEKSTAEKDQRDYASLELDNQTQLYFDLFKDLAEKGTATWRGQELSLNTVRDEGLLEQFKELYENTKKRIEDSSIGEKEQYLKSLKDYWDKIIGADPMEADPMEVDPMEADSMEKLEGLLETLKKKVGLSPVQRKILMNNLDSKKKKYGGIQGYLKSFDKAAENKATLKHLLVLIRNKLNELQKVA
jgi:hypothetical protein